MAVALSDLAQHLHGSGQSRLTICAAGVDRAAADGDGDAFEQCLGAALEVLGESAFPGERSRDVPADLARLQPLWLGLFDLKVELDPALTDCGVAGMRRRPEVAVVVAETGGNAYHQRSG